MAKQDDYTRYTIRLPTPLYERVKDAAGEASVNSLIVQVLEEKYPAPDMDDHQKAIIEALQSGRATETRWLGRRAIVLPLGGGGYRVSTTNMAIEDFLNFIEENGPHAIPPDSPSDD
jgi:hypothetical protein